MSEGAREASHDGDAAGGHPLGSLLRRFAGPHATGLLGGLGAVFLARIPERVPALLVGVALDAFLLGRGAYALPLVPSGWIPTDTRGQLWLTVGVLVTAVLAESALDWIGDWTFGRAALSTLHDVRTATYEAVVDLEMAYFDGRETGDVVSVLNDDVNNLEDAAQGARQGVEFAGKVLVAFAFMLVLHWELALVVAALPLVLAVTSRAYARALEPRYEAVRESVGRVNTRLQNAIGGIAAVKATAREPVQRDELAAASRSYRTDKWSAIRLRLGYDASTWVLLGAGTRGLLAVGGYWIVVGPPLGFSKPLTPGTLLTFFVYAQSFLFPIRRFAVEVIENYENALASAKRVVAVLDSDERVADRPDAPDLTVSDGRVTYEDVSFSYDGTAERTLTDVDLSVDGGEFVGVVGATGAGKSTLLKLLFRFYEPDEGRVAIDGQDVTSVSLESLREAIGYVSQDPFLFHGTVRENVGYAAPAADDEAVVEAATLAGAHEFVRDLPEGYDTQVGERGVKLSGGQRQRIAIARAILRDPPIMVLDEATSHVDNETEVQIQRSLDDLSGDRTTFVVAHRLSTVRDADRIVVLDDGRIVESGTHEELLDADGTYADLWRIQVGEVRAAVDGGPAAESEEVTR